MRVLLSLKSYHFHFWKTNIMWLLKFNIHSELRSSADETILNKWQYTYRLFLPFLFQISSFYLFLFRFHFYSLNNVFFCWLHNTNFLRYSCAKRRHQNSLISGVRWLDIWKKWVLLPCRSTVIFASCHTSSSTTIKTIKNTEIKSSYKISYHFYVNTLIFILL